MQPAPTTLTADLAGALGARRHRPPAELRADRRPAERAYANLRLPARAPAGPPGGSDLTGTPPGQAGFLIHQLLAAMPELRGPPPGLPQTISAYEAHLARRIQYSGPVRPVDLRI